MPVAEVTCHSRMGGSNDRATSVTGLSINAGFRRASRTTPRGEVGGLVGPVEAFRLTVWDSSNSATAAVLACRPTHSRLTQSDISDVMLDIHKLKNYDSHVITYIISLTSCVLPKSKCRKSSQNS